MKNRNSILNSLFKKSLDDDNRLKWDKICKNYSLDLVLNLFIWWVSGRERYRRNNSFESIGIVNKIKAEKGINYMWNKNFYIIYNLFPLFYNFYLENKSNIQELFCGDIYDKKKNNLEKYNDLEKIFEWQKFIEQDDSKQAKDYLNKLKYLYRIFTED